MYNITKTIEADIKAVISPRSIKYAKESGLLDANLNILRDGEDEKTASYRMWKVIIKLLSEKDTFNEFIKCVVDSEQPIEFENEDIDVSVLAQMGIIFFMRLYIPSIESLNSEMKLPESSMDLKSGLTNTDN